MFKIVLLVIFTVFFICGSYFQYKASKLLKKDATNSWGDKLVLRFSALPPNEYLTDEGKVYGLKARICSGVCCVLFFGYILFQCF